MEERLWWKIGFILRISGEIFFISIFKALFQSCDHSVPYDKNQRSFVKDMKCFCDVDKTPQILLNIQRTDKIKKGPRLTESKLYRILMCKNLFMILIWYQSLAFSNMSFASQFLSKYVSFFPSHEPKTYNFQVRSLHSYFKDVSFYGRAIFRLFPDVDHYDMQHMAVHRSCDWSRVGFLSCFTADQLIRWQRGDWWLHWHID